MRYLRVYRSDSVIRAMLGLYRMSGRHKPESPPESLA
jgi:hypothetical protein